MLGFVFLSVVLTAISIVLLLLLYVRWNFGCLETMKIPVIKRHFLWGSNPDFLEIKHHLVDLQRTKELGSIFGVYEGRTPTIYVSDPKHIKYILHEGSANFHKRTKPYPIIGEGVEFLNGKKWEELDCGLKGIFHPENVQKLYAPIISEGIQESLEYLKNLPQSNGKITGIDLHEFFAPGIMQVICRCFYNFKIDNVYNKDNEFVKTMRHSLFDFYEPDWTVPLSLSFRFLLKLPFGWPHLHGYKVLKKKILTSFNIGGNNCPMTQSLLEMITKCLADPVKHIELEITEETIFAQAYHNFMISYIGLMEVLKQCMLYLLENPKVYSKLGKEIQSGNSKEYLKAFVKECLRKSPIFFRLERVTAKKVQLGEITIKPGIDIAIPTYAIHHDSKLYPNPQEFNPERFLGASAKNSAPFFTLGEGGRECPGSHFLNTVAETFLAAFLMQYKIIENKNTQRNEKKGMHTFIKLDKFSVDLVKII